MELTLRRAQMFSSLSDPTADDDFDVLDRGKRIGRVYFHPWTVLALEPFAGSRKLANLVGRKRWWKLCYC